ncbi:MAG: phosphate signaling complex protein PhoU, partial [Oscillospiraceae bacterium]
KSLIERDRPLAEQIARSDSEIDQKESEIEALCLKLLLQQQPVARDLRVISSALKMITDMERIGDQAADIADIALQLIDGHVVEWPQHIPDMARATIKMVSDSIDAFVRHDLSLAQEVMESDDLVDALFVRVRSELIAGIHRNPQTGEQALDMLMIAKYFERIGDHATNIAEWVVFSITGQHHTQMEEQ